MAALWIVPQFQRGSGTLVVIAAGRSATSLPSTELLLGQGGEFSAVGTVSGSVPVAPDQRQLLAVSIAGGTYDSVKLGDDAQPVAITITVGQVEPLLLGIDSGHLIRGGAYAGNDDVNLGLGELAGKFVPMPAFALTDQSGHAFNLDSLAGKDVVIAAFHTTCHETCPLYTALFLQLAKQTKGDVTLVEVTTDPGTDTPSVLSAYGRVVGASWTFATGSPAELTSFWQPFGVELATGDTHVSTLALIDRHGYIRLVYRGVPKVGGPIPPALTTSLSAAGLTELSSGGDGWGAPDVLQALVTISRAEESASSAGGGHAPDFTLRSTDGGSVSLTSLLGKPLVINFWATYCPPCKAEMPMLVRDVGAQKGITLVLINEGQDASTAKGFLTALGIGRQSLLDSGLSVGRAYGLSALPMTVFVRADGTIDRRQVGQLDERVLASELSVLGSQ